MRTLSILIKPASGLCNLNCKYCFYHDEMKNRTTSSYGIMNEETVYNLLNKTLHLKDVESISFAFQGGEPTIAGINYFKKFIKAVNELNSDNVRVFYSLQTNGLLLNEEFAKFFKENNFLIGISLDGTKLTHDKYRVDNKDNPTFDIILSKIELLKKYNVDFNILTVISKDVALDIENIFKFYEKMDFKYQQYIPLINPIGDNNIYDFTLLNHNYLKFLNTSFNIYYKTIKKGKYIYNRFLENIISLLLYDKAENCAMNGNCSIQYVIEANGNVYPCDFYSLDDYLLGNININSIKEIDLKRFEINFLHNDINNKCLECKYYKLCKNGCKRDRINNKNTYCSAYYQFFEKNLDKLIELKNLALKNEFPRPEN